MMEEELLVRFRFEKEHEGRLFVAKFPEKEDDFNDDFFDANAEGVVVVVFVVVIIVVLFVVVFLPSFRCALRLPFFCEQTTPTKFP